MSDETVEMSDETVEISDETVMIAWISMMGCGQRAWSVEIGIS